MRPLILVTFIAVVLLSGCSSGSYSDIEELMSDIERKLGLECTDTTNPSAFFEWQSAGCGYEPFIHAELHARPTLQEDAEAQRSMVGNVDSIDGIEAAVAGDGYQWTVVTDDPDLAVRAQQALGGTVVGGVEEYDDLVGPYEEDGEAAR